MKNGKVAKIMDKGFGFIAVEGEEKDYFFHANELVDIAFDDLQEGEPVEFEVADGPKGPNAVQVRRASGDAAPAEEATSDEA